MGSSKYPNSLVLSSRNGPVLAFKLSVSHIDGSERDRLHRKASFGLISFILDCSVEAGVGYGGGRWVIGVGGGVGWIACDRWTVGVGSMRSGNFVDQHVEPWMGAILIGEYSPS